MTDVAAALEELVALEEVIAPTAPIVTVNGVRYEPADGRTARPTFAVGITTHNRWEMLSKALGHFEAHTPPEIPIFVVDDGSTEPGPEFWNGRFELERQKNLGVAAAKNRCLELMERTGADHFFLFDDDTWPQVDGWWKPYVESEEPHLMYCFEDFAGVAKPTLNDCRIVHRDPRLIGYSVPRGVMVYAERSVLERVGGMDRAFGMWGYEHGDWSNRIHAAGMTTMRYGDVPRSERLIFSSDEHVYELGGHQRSLSSKGRREAAAINKVLHDHQWNLDAYREYRRPRDVVLTAYITGVRDPQRRGRQWTFDPNELEGLRKSVPDGELVVLVNQPPEASSFDHLVKIETPDNPYFGRWLEHYRWLRAHPEVRWVWCVDATDVVQLHHPEDLEPGKLYVGSEPSITGNPWMLEHHPEYAEWLAENADLPLLNCGIVGGDRETVMRLAHRIIREYHDQLGAGRLPVFDMGAFNFVVRTGGFDFITGPKVHTVFKQNDHANPVAWWSHK